MKYAYAVRFVNGLPTASEKHQPSLLRLKLLLRLLGDPQNKIKSIAICGIENKAIIAKMVSSVLGSGNYTNGVYCPLEYVDPRNAIEYCGEPISTDDFCCSMSKVYEAVRQINKAYTTASQDTLNNVNRGLYNAIDVLKSRGISNVFTKEEILLAAAVLYFSIKNCKMVVAVQTSGGRNAPICALPPSDAVVVSLIPNDIADIDSELASIKKGVREVVCVNQSPRVFSRISDKCATEGARLAMTVRSEIKIKKHGFGGIDFTYKTSESMTVKLPLLSMTKNAAAVAELAISLKRCGMSISDKAVTNGIQSSIGNSFLNIKLLSISPVIIISLYKNTCIISDILESIADIPVDKFGKCCFAFFEDEYTNSYENDVFKRIKSFEKEITEKPYFGVKKNNLDTKQNNQYDSFSSVKFTNKKELAKFASTFKGSDFLLVLTSMENYENVNMLLHNAIERVNIRTDK